MSSARLVPVPSAYVERVWPRVVEFIASGLEAVANVWTVEGVKERCQDARLQLWALRREGKTVGAIVTEVYETTAGKTVAMQIAGGEAAGAWDTIGTIEAWGREVGCVRSEIIGRAGWDRVMRPRGYERIAVVVAKRLDE